MSKTTSNNQNSLLCKGLAHLKKHFLLIMTFLGVALGILLGFTLRPANLTSETIMIISFPGDLLMRMLKMLVLPLVVSSLITGVAVLDPKSSGKIGLYSITYYMATTILAAILGIILVVSIKPGTREIKAGVGEGTASSTTTTQDAIMDLIRNLFPENLIQATIQQGQTYYTYESSKLVKTNDSSGDMNSSLSLKKKWNFKYNDNTNILGVIAFCIAFGMIIGSMGRKAEILLHLLLVLNEITMKLVKLIMWYSPVGILFLVAGKILEIDDMANIARKLGLYMITVIVGLLIHCFVTLTTLYFTMTRKNPFKFYYGCLQAVITGFGLGSSSATLPVTFRCLEENLKIDSRVTRFVLPVGATINMDGTALYEAVAPIFIAQMNDRHLNFVEYIIISLTATVASVGAASIPSAGLVTMVIVLQSVGLPVKDISLIFAVDFFLDRLRTAVNILGDSIGAGIVNHLCRDELNKLNEEDLEKNNEIAAIE